MIQEAEGVEKQLSLQRSRSKEWELIVIVSRSLN